MVRLALLLLPLAACSLFQDFDGYTGGGASSSPAGGSATDGSDAAPGDGPAIDGPSAGGPRLVVMGGLREIGGAETDEVLVASVGAEGSLGPWMAGAHLPRPAASQAVAIAGGVIYLAGGSSQDRDIADVVFGGPGGWTATRPLTAERRAARAAVQGGFLYVIGGIFGGGMESTVELAPAQAAGPVGAWDRATDLPTRLAGHAVAAARGSIFVTGGGSNDAVITFQNDAYAARPAGDGKFFIWEPESSFATRRGYHAMTASEGFLYLSGGQTFQTGDLNDVQYVAVQSDGSLARGWETTSSFQGPRRGHAMVIAGGFLYVIGGRNASSVLADVQVAPVNADGTLGAFRATTPLPSGRFFHAGAAL